MHIKRCARRQNMFIITSLKHALPPPPQGSIRSKKNLNNHPVGQLYTAMSRVKNHSSLRFLFETNISIYIIYLK
jgi:hypothetical protein